MHRKLYYSGLSPYARKVRILLSELKLEYQSDRFDRMRPVENICTVNPNLSVPVLEDKGQLLFDSTVISEYLLETYGSGVSFPDADVPLFVHPYRADYKWEDLKLLATLETLTESIVSVFLHTISIEGSGSNPNEIAYLDRQRVRIEKILDWIEPRATQEGFCPGNFCLSDVALISALGMCDAIKLYDWTGRSRIEGLVANFERRESVSSTSPVA